MVSQFNHFIYYYIIIYTHINGTYMGEGWVMRLYIHTICIKYIYIEGCLDVNTANVGPTQREEEYSWCVWGTRGGSYHRSIMVRIGGILMIIRFSICVIKSKYKFV